MTIKECIDIVDNIKPNQYTIKEKVMWLSFIDEIIINEVLQTHEGYDGRYDGFEGYSEEDLSRPLIVPSPYDRLYTAYLKMKIDGENGETARYNNSASLYNTYMLEYRKHYNKTHMPISTTERRTTMPTQKANIGLSEAEYENLKKDLTFILTEYFSDSVSADRLAYIIAEYAQNNIGMLKGKDGYTPKKGVDYFTEAEVNAFKNAAKGENGISPSVVVSETKNGHVVTITDASGTKSFNVKNGSDGQSIESEAEPISGGHRVTIYGAESTSIFDVKDGNDGLSPTISVSDNAEGHTLIIQDSDGVKYLDIKDGVGVSSVIQAVTSTEDDGVNLITLTLTDGSQTSFRVKNGSKGSIGDKGDKGDKGDSPVRGVDYYTESDKAAIINELNYKRISSVNLKGGAENWIEEEVFDSSGKFIGYRYGQVVNVNNAVITPTSMVYLQLTAEQVIIFHNKTLAFCAENDGGVVTVYCVGQIPENDYTIQATVTEVVIDG